MTAAAENRTFGRLIRNINWYPPFLGMGIRVRQRPR